MIFELWRAHFQLGNLTLVISSATWSGSRRIPVRAISDLGPDGTRAIYVRPYQIEDLVEIYKIAWRQIVTIN
jgi:hypothetical protein